MVMSLMNPRKKSRNRRNIPQDTSEAFCVATKSARRGCRQMPNKQRQLLVTSNLDTEDIDDLEEQVWLARKKLFDALKKENSNNSDLGGLEGYGTLLRLAAMDKDGSMQIEDAEVKQAEAAAEKLVEQTLNVSLNGGVISALLLSMVFPYTLEPIAVAVG